MTTAPFFSPFVDPEIAYFCAEFALGDNLPIYSGGLGVLAGDVLRQANDDGMAMVAVGLFYNQGYFEQGVDQTGRQVHQYKTIDPIAAGLQPLTDINNRPVLISIPYQQQTVWAQVWLAMVGQIRVYLLDTKIEQNSAELQSITDHLYNPDPHMRIAQEMVLGIGGTILLRQLGFKPKVYHLNEGHSAFAAFELASHYQIEQGLDFDQAFAQAKSQIVFTNHTIVAAGNDVFARHMVLAALQDYAERQGLPIEAMLAMGQDDDSQGFSMTILALNASHIANTVSKIHHQAAKSVWPNHAMTWVTNGVHLPTWVNSDIAAAVSQITVEALEELELPKVWQLHQANKKRMLAYVEKQTGVALDKDILTAVWARRFAAYKRPSLILQDVDCLHRLVEGKQLQIIFAGKAHPKDEIGQDIFADIHRLIRLHGLEASVVVVPNYSMGMAQILEAGADVWLNTPIRGQEASGTSGMKAGANGALHLSTSDGWMDEVDWSGVGWIVPDDHTADALLQTMTDSILPLFKTEQGQPSVEWLVRMKQTMAISWRDFSAARMMEEYRQRLYQPIIGRSPDTVTEWPDPLLIN